MIERVSRVTEEGGQLAFLHVLTDSQRRRFGRVAAPEYSSAKALEASRQLQSLVGPHDSGSEVLVSASSSSVHDEILRVATERKADLIVLGATRRTGLRRRFLGSTALRVSRRSPVPVLVLPAVHVKRNLSPLDEAVLGWAA